MDAEQTDYRVAVHFEDGSYWAEVQELPGCFAAGDSMEELWEALTEAISLYLSSEGSEVRVQMEKKDLLSTTESFGARVLVG